MNAESVCDTSVRLCGLNNRPRFVSVQSLPNSFSVIIALLIYICIHIKIML